MESGESVERKNLSARLSSSRSRATSICASLSTNIVAYREQKRKSNRQIQEITDIEKKETDLSQKKENRQKIKRTNKNQKIESFGEEENWFVRWKKNEK